MRTWRLMLLLMVLLLLTVFSTAVVPVQSGDSYDLTWSTIDGGGYTFSSGGNYILGGTIGQPDAGGLSGGDYTLGGGFWGGGVTATPTAFVYLPHVARQYPPPTVTLTQTPTPPYTPTATTTTPTNTPTPTATPWGDRPGDYTDYTFNNAGPFYNLDIYSTWQSSPSAGYIYPAFTFGFQANQGGYMGMQLVGTQKKALFSIWDITEGSGTAQPVSDWCRRFSGEGTGAQCLIDYAWVSGREYRLRLWAAGSDQNGESWVAAIQDTVTGIETQIGVIYLYNSNGYTGYGWLRPSASIFLEYFGGPLSCNNQPYSRVLWRGPFANANTYTANRAVVPFYPNCTHNNVTTSGWPYVTHEAGGQTVLTTPAGTVLWEVP